MLPRAKFSHALSWDGVTGCSGTACLRYGLALLCYKRRPPSMPSRVGPASAGAGLQSGKHAPVKTGAQAEGLAYNTVVLARRAEDAKDPSGIILQRPARDSALSSGPSHVEPLSDGRAGTSSSASAPAGALRPPCGAICTSTNIGGFPRGERCHEVRLSTCAFR
jgi:hypothetical protein